MKQHVSVTAGRGVFTLFAVPTAGLLLTGGPAYLPVVLLPVAAYVAVRWQERLAITLHAARAAWQANADVD